MSSEEVVGGGGREGEGGKRAREGGEGWEEEGAELRLIRSPALKIPALIRTSNAFVT